jgi:phage terminase large subunit-like protein
MEETRTATRRAPPTAEEIIDWGNRYLAGATAPMLARMSGRTTGSIEHYLKTNRFLKKQHPEAVFCWRGTAAFEASRACAGKASAPEPGHGAERRAVYRVKGEGVWTLARAAYLSGWSAARVAAHYGVTEAALRKRAAKDGWRKCDLPDVAEPMPPPPGSGAVGADGLADLPVGGEGDGLDLHEHQTPPTGDWSTWLVLGGRGAGKTLAGAVWVADQAARLGAGGRIALIGATLHDVRTVMIEGASGILNLPRWGETRPAWRPSLRTLRFPGGCEAQAFSAEDPDSLRGPQFHCAWADEFCAWKGAGDALAMARLGLRLTRRVSLPLVGRDGREAARVGANGEAAGVPHPDGFAVVPPHEGEGDGRPQLVVTTTPRPTRALRRLMGEGSCAVTRAGTQANAAYLSPGFVAGLKALYGGTRLEAQEIEGQVVDDGLALFSAEMMAGARGVSAGTWGRVVVGVDPSVTAGGNACGIVVVGRVGEACEVLADRTVGGVSPEAWARAVVAAAGDYQAAEVVAEVNQGGELVTGLLRAVGAGLKVTGVRASVGKRARAEPVAALYEQGRVRHVGAGLERLEEELMAVGDEAGDLDRADALVWAVTHLMLGARAMTPRARSTW